MHSFPWRPASCDASRRHVPFPFLTPGSQNIHHPRTAKKVVMFTGARDPASGRWTFALNPALCWRDLSADTRLRLAGLLEEASAGGWCCKALTLPICPSASTAGGPQD